MSNVTHEDAMQFIKMLKERMPDWSYDNCDDVIEYIEEILWRNYASNVIRD